MARIASGDTTWVAVPFFLMRNFRHRCFFVRESDERASFQDLVGGRIGTDNWMASGDTWSRAAIREQGIGTDRFTWVCGPVEGVAEDRPQGNLPPNASMAPPGRGLRDMLLDGELDALMVPDPPRGFLEPDSPFRRLFRDFRSVEEAYYDRTGIWPGLHLAVVRRTVAEEHPGGTLTVTASRSVASAFGVGHGVHRETWTRIRPVDQLPRPHRRTTRLEPLRQQRLKPGPPRVRQITMPHEA
ncbi:hypothetical protein SAMN06297387_10855 [Streptomyces zhaozhouensis]|uniref:Uncharacterized protein n=1 Tax=Streptomyces zhaozhouensis TaxID=1300267 RepID=A0A286DW57_9ACTN|nr:hypothetical protein [Streptomyces zhaozhouensis]SOD62892.1 hypothetical protein SAMN06297387_10855 [Streptomyces zhaozhouensis]